MSETPPGLALAEQADRLFQPGDADRRWYVLHAKPRCEKKAAKTCLDAEIRHYLPLRQSRPRQHKGQRRYSFDVPQNTSRSALSLTGSQMSLIANSSKPGRCRKYGKIRNFKVLSIFWILALYGSSEAGNSFKILSWDVRTFSTIEHFILRTLFFQHFLDSRSPTPQGRRAHRKAGRTFSKSA